MMHHDGKGIAAAKQQYPAFPDQRGNQTGDAQIERNGQGSAQVDSDGPTEKIGAI